MQKIDDQVLNFINNHSNNPILTKFMKFCTFLGDFCFIWIIYVLVAIMRHEKRLAIALVLVMLVVNAVNNGFIKAIFRRNRPFEDYPDIKIEIANPYGSSFPSGHSANAFACAVIIAAFYPNFGFLAFVLASLIAVSRMYLKVHYFSDVVVGSIVGALTGLAMLFVL